MLFIVFFFILLLGCSDLRKYVEILCFVSFKYWLCIKFINGEIIIIILFVNNVGSWKYIDLLVNV